MVVVDANDIVLIAVEVVVEVVEEEVVVVEVVVEAVVVVGGGGVVEIWNCTCTVSRRVEKAVEAVKELICVMVPIMKMNEEEEEVVM